MLSNKCYSIATALILLTALFLFAFNNAGIVENNSEEAALEDAEDTIGVLLEGLSRGQFTVMVENGYHITFHHADGTTGGRDEGMVSTAGGKIVMEHSDPDQTVVGVSVEVKAHHSASGIAEIIVAEGDFEDLRITDDVIIETEYYRSDSITSEDTIAFEVGEVE